jgi:hypothetical protein
MSRNAEVENNRSTVAIDEKYVGRLQVPVYDALAVKRAYGILLCPIALPNRYAGRRQRPNDGGPPNYRTWRFSRSARVSCRRDLMYVW